MDVDLGRERVRSREDYELLPLPDLLPLLQRLAAHARGGVHDLSAARRADSRPVDLVRDLVVALLLLPELALPRAQVALRLRDGGGRALARAFERHALLLHVALELRELALVRERLEELELALRGLERQLARAPAELVALELRLGYEVLREELLRPLVLVLRLLHLLLADGEVPLLGDELRRIVAVLVLVEVLLRELVVLLGELDVALGLVLLDVERLARDLERALGVAQGDLLAVLLVDLGRDVELHEHLALLHDLPLRDERDDGRAALHLVLERYLLARRDLAVLLDVDDERTLLHGRVQRLGLPLVPAPLRKQDKRSHRRSSCNTPDCDFLVHPPYYTKSTAFPSAAASPQRILAPDWQVAG